MVENKKVKVIAENAIIAAIYVAMTLINPIGWLMLQFRVSEVLAILPFYNKKYRAGIILGVAIANAFSPMGIIDVIVGASVCLISYYIVGSLIKNIWLNSIQYAIIAGILVAAELYYVFNAPYILSFLSVTASTIVTGIIGVFVCKNLSKLTRK